MRKIDKSKLSTRAFNCLRWMGIKYDCGLLLTSKELILNEPTVGKVTLHEIIDYGRSLGIDIPETASSGFCSKDSFIGDPLRFKLLCKLNELLSSAEDVESKGDRELSGKVELIREILDQSED